jgi:hypothetical protein
MALNYTAIPVDMVFKLIQYPHHRRNRHPHLTIRTKATLKNKFTFNLLKLWKSRLCMDL